MSKGKKPLSEGTKREVSDALTQIESQRPGILGDTADEMARRWPELADLAEDIKDLLYGDGSSGSTGRGN